MSGQLSRLGRWIVPAALLTAAGSGIALLAADELLGPSIAPAPVADRPIEPAAVRGEAAPPAGVVALAPAPPRGPGAPAARAGAAPSSTGPGSAARGSGRPIVRETPEVLYASQHLAQLARVRSLPERLQALDAMFTGLPDVEALRVMEGLLDSELPGDSYESEALRLALLGKVARRAGGRAERILVERLGAARPRPERLAAIDALAARDAGRGELEAIASHDHDVVVQRKAQWALQRTP